jgi:predicted nucleic acid-binding protein
MICVDTSVWVEFFKGSHQTLVFKVKKLIDEVTMKKARKHDFLGYLKTFD